MPNVHEIIRDHVSLSIGCVDRLYVNGYVPTLQIRGQLCLFMMRHLGQPIPSPALLHLSTIASLPGSRSMRDGTESP